MPAISQETSLLLQCLATTSLLLELCKADFIKSEYFKLLKFENEGIKNILVQSGIGNPATMQMMLYALLIVPKETLSRLEYELLESYVKTLNPMVCSLAEVGSTRSTYKGESDSSEIDYLRHIRNALAHSKCEFLSEGGRNFVVFVDVNKDASETCSIKIECYKVEFILIELQKLIIDYYNKTYQTEN